MGLIDRIRGFLFDDPYESGLWYQPLFTAADVMRMDAAQLYREQPHLRTVVSFMARNVAQLGLHTFDRVNETDRVRNRTSTTAQTLRRPNADTTAYELVWSLIGDLMLFDLAYWYVAEDAGAPTGWEIRRIPVPWVTPRKGNAFRYEEFRVQAPGAVDFTDVPASSMLVFHGWSPTSERDGTTPIQALRLTLAEQLHALRYREAVWKRGGRVSSIINRPKGHKWTDSQRDAFRADWKSKFTSGGSEEGGTPILEDGMTIEKLDFSAHEQEFVEGTKLALTTVAAVYHINPVMVGLLDDANFSNVREFRKMLYGDTLGPVLAMVEDRCNTFLVPRLDPGQELYLEFNIAEKLQGNFEEQTQALQAAVGRPWMTADEARARNNMPALGGDAEELVTPLNVLIGGQQSPADGETEGGGGGTLDELEAAQETAGRLSLVKATLGQGSQDVLGAFLARQRGAVLSRVGAKRADWWDSARWDAELAEALAATMPAGQAEQVARKMNAWVQGGIESRLETRTDDETAVGVAGEVFDLWARIGAARPELEARTS